VLNNDLTTKQAKQGDRFTMTVREPGQFDGAVIEGTVGSVTQSGSLTGRSGMMLNFDTIRLRNGQTYKFAGTLSSVRTQNGAAIKVDNEGSAQGGNQTSQTVTRTGIGTAIGAIIGAIAGGGKGAAIGGIIGAAGGAGSVYVTGKDNLELPSGTELTIKAGAAGQISIRQEEGRWKQRRRPERRSLLCFVTSGLPGPQPISKVRRLSKSR
jgi:hypothetical protein